MNSNEEYLKWGTLARQFLKSAKFQSKKIIETGNQWCVITERKTIDDAAPSSAEYDNITEASDHNIGIPVVYTFYHGLELILKGLIAKANQRIPKNHDLNTLLDKFKEYYPMESALIAELESHINISQMNEDNPIKKFCEDNEIDAAAFYQALRYPESFNGKDYLHVALKYNEKIGSDYFQTIINTIEFIMKESNRFFDT